MYRSAWGLFLFRATARPEPGENGKPYGCAWRGRHLHPAGLAQLEACSQPSEAGLILIAPAADAQARRWGAVVTFTRIECARAF